MSRKWTIISFLLWAMIVAWVVMLECGPHAKPMWDDFVAKIVHLYFRR